MDLINALKSDLNIYIECPMRNVFVKCLDLTPFPFYVPGISEAPGKPEDKPGFDGVGACPCRCLPQN